MIRVSGWSDIQSIEEINVGRYFEYDEDAMFMFGRWFPFLLRPSVRVLEVGAGTGYFTDKLLTLNPEMDLTCLEPDGGFLRYLREHFGARINVVDSTLENSEITRSSFDVALSHIVIHNLPDAIVALKRMKESVKDGGYVVTIEPHPGSRTHYPTQEIDEAINFLFQVKTLRWERRMECIDYPESRNPWNYCYPQIFHEAGLSNIHSYGWNSVFTLSDSRFDIGNKRKWNLLRKSQILRERERCTEELLELGKNREEIERAYSIILEYFERIDTMSDEELKSVHEQHVYPRIITIGQKRE